MVAPLGLPYVVRERRRLPDSRLHVVYVILETKEETAVTFVHGRDNEAMIHATGLALAGGDRRRPGRPRRRA